MYAQLNSQIIYYERVGEGEKNILMLHGNGASHDVFDVLSEAVKDRYTVYLPDTRGHGLSATPKEYHYMDMAEDLNNLIGFLDIKQPDILGFSDGAIIAMLCAIKYPQNCGTLYLCGGNMNPKGLTFKAAHEIKKAFRKDRNPLTELMLNEPNIPPDLLSRISSKAFVFAGENDMIKESETRKIASLIPDSELHILPGEDHGSYVEHSSKLAEFI
ncbi:MAG: alpha/beta hydrolase [Lachnospiraceae bacterium]|nr:alpha/beta hydrolase [Lachnospiraceae bacterium]